MTTSSGGTGYLAHVFPVQGPHWTRGFIGEFGAPRSGRVVRRGHDPVLMGHFLVIGAAATSTSRSAPAAT